MERVGECLYRYNGNGTYYAVLKKNGKQSRCSLQTTDRTLAKRNLAEKRAQLDKLDISNARMSIDQLCDLYFKTISRQAAKTLYRKNAIKDRLLNDWPTGLPRQINKIRRSHIERWLAGYKFGIPSYNLHLSFVRDIFQLAQDDRLLAISPVIGLKGERCEEPTRHTPTYEEFHQIIQSVRTLPYYDYNDSADYIAMLGEAGIGQAELNSLRWRDVRFDTNEIHLFRHKTKTAFIVPLYPNVHNLLSKIKERKKGVVSSDEFIFKMKNPRKSLAHACKRLEFGKTYSPRSLRRMFVTRALQKGIDVKTLSSWQGHRDGGKLILTTYSHVLGGHSQKMAALMGDMESEPMTSSHQQVAA